MNYLAHSTLAESSDEARLGSLLGDFSKGLEPERLTPAMRFALEEHRAVDRWFDALPEIRAERLAYPKQLRRFSGILTDVFFDHFLVRRWQDLTEEPLPDVTSSLYRALQEHANILPPRLRSIAPSMIEHDWLGSYGDVRNIERALHGIERRMRRDTRIVEGLEVLERRGDEIEALVLRVFPMVVRFTRDRRARLQSES